ncbi:MAG: tRNA1(Val) (adenine(37)-N6)-methyltransferase [Bacteroidota bacterium]
MANTWFKFKQFTIFHDKTAMKVGTDSVLLGAWAGVEGKEKILDIGTGTGIIAIMLAQRSLAKIEGIEIEEEAFNQAVENAKKSPWSDRITMFRQSFQDFSEQNGPAYDGIVSNPPFFDNSLPPSNNPRVLAKHTSELNRSDLLHGVTRLLKPRGTFSVILPYTTESEFIDTARGYNLFVSRKMNIRPTAEKDYHRIMIEFSTEQGITTEEFLTIEKGERHDYTDEYKDLTKDFYLKF